jgi:hypothetical protein
MIPTRFFILAAFAGLGISSSFAGSLEDEQIRAAWQAGRESTFSGRALEAAKVAASGQALRNLIARENPAPYRQIAGELIGYTTALAWAKQGDFEKAGEAFSSEITAQESAANPFLQNTRNPYYFAQDVFVLHSEIAAHTEQEIANTGYLIFPVGGGPERPFVFIYSTDEPGERGIAIQGLDDTVQRRMIYLTAPGPQGHYRIADRAQVLADRATFSAALRFDNGKPYLAIDGVKRVVKYASGQPNVYDSPVEKVNLLIDGGKLEQPFAALNRIGEKPGPFSESLATPSRPVFADTDDSVTAPASATTAPEPEIPESGASSAASGLNVGSSSLKHGVGNHPEHAERSERNNIGSQGPEQH